jgi:UDP-N-acetyl-D-galactosamine dehydrogenase
MSKTIAIIGLGYVGLPLAIEFGKNRKVIGFDINEKRVDELKRGIDKTNEVSCEDLNLAKNLSYCSNADAIKQAQIYIITVPTPIDRANRPDFSFLVNASRVVGKALKKDDIVIYESTVYPGCTEEICVPVLENVSGLVFNKDFFCGYSPERINPGDKVNTLTKIKKITSGSTPKILIEIDDLYASIITAGTFQTKSIRIAEAAKVIENCQRDLNIAFINELSLIFNKLDIDTLEVLQAAGSKWNFLPFRPGLVGGHCIGVDPYYLTHKAEALGYHPQVILAGRRINDGMSRYVATEIIRKMANNTIDIAGSTVVVMGVTFKENCPDIRNSKVFDLVEELKKWNINVLISDPWADEADVYREHAMKLTSWDDCKFADAIIVAVGHREYREVQMSKFQTMCKWQKKPILGDLKSLYKREELADLGFDVFRL